MSELMHQGIVGLEREVAEKTAALEAAQAEADAKRIALAASDERLMLAGLRVDLYFGCDTAQHLADEIVNLRVDLRHAKAEAERLRAENARLRKALGQYAKHDNWDGHPLDYRSDTITYDIWQGGEDFHGWETAERALATNETPTAI